MFCILQHVLAGNFIMRMWRAGCVWTSYLANGELEMFPRDGLGGERDIEKLQLLR